MRGVALLGATGSIGDSTLAVMAEHPQDYRVVGLTAHRDVAAMHTLCLRHRPQLVAMADPAAAQALRAALAGAGGASGTEVLAGASGLEAVAAMPDAEIAVAGIVGAAGLGATLAAARAGKTLLLANKEALVMAGTVFMDAVRTGGATLIPIDSEQNAIFQCLPAYRCGDPAPTSVRRVVLTASGGPFLRMPQADLRGVTPDQACAHPNWSMGRKISVDSATLMNKGLEVIEAAWLFALEAGRIDVVVHPQSLVHSLVEFVDGTLLAQLARPDMRVPIAHALAWPQRITSGVSALELAVAGRLDFEAPDRARFPCLDLAYAALREGGCAGATLNAANEIAVQAFLDGALAFTSIADVIEATLAQVPPRPADNLDAVLEADATARLLAARHLRARR